MASVKFIQGSEEWQMFQDFWRLCQAVWIPEEASEYWEDALGKADNFWQKYNTEFSKALARVLVNELDRRYKSEAFKRSRE